MKRRERRKVGWKRKKGRNERELLKRRNRGVVYEVRRIRSWRDGLAAGP